jgi:catechol 2,3-dioxygenase-like lactoylglutathione lyase family enzyme
MAEAQCSDRQQQQPPPPPEPIPGPPYIPQSFQSSSHGSAIEGAVLNHVALQIESASLSLAFYIDFLGMSLIFAINTGPFTAYYLGYAQPSDPSPAEMAVATGVRSGLLELILPHDDIEGAVEGQCHTKRRGFAHIGIRVSDVSETLKLAEQRGWKVVKRLVDVAVKDMPLPGWDGEIGRETKWQGGFEKTFAQIGFLEDPDGYVS